MLRSLFSGISGLRANQTMLDVTGNNIANANTVGFKASTTVFQDTLSQMLTGGAGPERRPAAAPTRSRSASACRSAASRTNFSQGSAQITGRPTDLMIQGDGFFVVQRNGENLYTRAGAFDFDATGNLVTPDGDLVQGYAARRDRRHHRDRRPRRTSPSRTIATADPRQPAEVLQHRSGRRDHRRVRRRHQAARCSRSRSPTSPTRRAWRRSATPPSAPAPTPAPPSSASRRPAAAAPSSAARWRCPTSTWPRSSPT